MFAPYDVWHGPVVPYGSLTLTETSPPQSFTEPLSLTEIVGYLCLPTSALSDAAITSDLSAFICGAREQAEILQGRDLVTKQWDLTFDYWPCDYIELRSPVSSVDLVQYRDSDGNYTTLTAGTDYVVDTAKSPAVLTPPYGQTFPAFTPWPSSAVLIRFTGGMPAASAWWSDAGGRVKQGMRLLIKSWFNREIPNELQTLLLTNLMSQGEVPRIR